MATKPSSLTTHRIPAWKLSLIILSAVAVVAVVLVVSILYLLPKNEGSSTSSTSNTSGAADASLPGTTILTDHWTGINATSTAYFGGLPIAVANSNLGLLLGRTTVGFPTSITTGSYLLTYVISGVNAEVTPPSLTPVNCALVEIWKGATQFSATAPDTSGISNSIIVSAYIDITSSGAVVNFTGGTLPASGNVVDLYVTQINSAVSS